MILQKHLDHPSVQPLKAVLFRLHRKDDFEQLLSWREKLNELEASSQTISNPYYYDQNAQLICHIELIGEHKYFSEKKKNFGFKLF